MLADDNTISPGSPQTRLPRIPFFHPGSSHAIIPISANNFASVFQISSLSQWLPPPSSIVTIKRFGF